MNNKQRDALVQIIDEAREYSRRPERFRPLKECSLETLHIYREGVRDGKNQAARIAESALEGER